MSDRIAATFAACRAENRAALVTFITAGDPDFTTASAIFSALPEAGADIIELGVPFTDPMADGPAIQAAGLRALKTGQTLARTLEMAANFRKTNTVTPIVLMGYFNPIYVYGVDTFLRDAKAAGVDGLIVVDLPPEEDDQLCLPALQAGLHFIRLATPTTDDKRLPAVLANSSGFVYYVSVNGITGSAIANFDALDTAVGRIQKHTALPVVVGFGVKTENDARTISRNADGVVVGSALVEEVRKSLDADGKATANTVDAVIKRVQELARGVRTARPAAAE